MILAFSVLLAVVVVWSLVARRVESLYVTLPLALITVGVAVGWESSFAIFEHLSDPRLERSVEVLLALLLFLDATEVRAIHRWDVGVLVRLVLVGVPLSLFTAAVLTGWLYPEMRVALCFILACVLVPTDMAPAASVVKDRRLPRRLRDILNTESGYNDGVVAPFFLVGVAFLTGGVDGPEKGGEALLDMLPAALWAVGIGGVVGAGAAYLSRLSQHHGWTTARWRSLGILATPLLAYTLTIAVDGNGFVAAFVAGLAHRAVSGPEAHETLGLSEDVAAFAQIVMWFVFGQLLEFSVREGLDPRVLVLAVAAVTVVRVLPVLLVLFGSTVRWRDRVLIGWLGPRGIASIVFALLAIQHLGGEDSVLLVQVVSVTVVLSAVVHGISAPLIARHLSGAARVRSARRARQAPEPGRPVPDGPPSVDAAPSS